MKREDEQINIDLPSMAEMQAHKRRLKVALLTYYERQSHVKAFGKFIIEKIKFMSLGKKSTAIITIAFFGLVVTAGIFGPRASEVAQAEAVSTVRRAFGRLAILTEEQKTELNQKFQDKVHFRDTKEQMFRRIMEMTDEEIQAHHAEIKTSLMDSLAEAQSAEDLKVLSADEMPESGFIGRAGRAFGFKMMRHNLNNLENLPEDIKARIAQHEEMRPVKFLIYTNNDLQKVTIGLNANDEPVVKFVEGESMFGNVHNYGNGRRGERLDLE